MLPVPQKKNPLVLVAVATFSTSEGRHNSMMNYTRFRVNKTQRGKKLHHRDLTKLRLI